MLTLYVLTYLRQPHPGPLHQEREWTPPPQSGTPFDYVESSISEGEAFRTHEMGTNNPPAIPLAPLEGGNGHPYIASFLAMTGERTNKTDKTNNMKL